MASFYQQIIITKTINQKRKIAHRTKEQLDRMRRLYVRLNMSAIAKDTTGVTLDVCARKMVDSGLYAMSYKDVRYAILRRMWKYDYKSRLTWHQWTTANGWVGWHWSREGVYRYTRLQMEARNDNRSDIRRIAITT